MLQKVERKGHGVRLGCGSNWETLILPNPTPMPKEKQSW